MKDPIDKFRFDEDSDTGRSRYHGAPPAVPARYVASPLSKVPPPASPPTGGAFTEHVPNYTEQALDTNMNYPTSHDLSPLRGDYTVSSPSSQETPGHTRTYSQGGYMPGGYRQPEKQEDYDSGYPVSYGFSDQDNNTNLLAASPHKNLRDKNVHSSREYPSDVAHSYSSRENGLDISKSGSSGDSRNDYNGTSSGSGQVYTERFPGPQSLKYARERNLREARENLKYRSSSLGDTGSRGNLHDSKEALTKSRTPSAPGDLSRRGRGHYGNRDDYGLTLDRSRSGQMVVNSRAAEHNNASHISRVDTVDRRSHSIMSGEYRVQDQNLSNNKSIISTTSTVRMDDSLRRSGILHSTANSGYSTVNSGYSSNQNSLKHRNIHTSHQANGAATLVRDKPPVSPDSPVRPGGVKPLDCSKDSSSSLCPSPPPSGALNSLVSLALFALLSLVVCVIALQLLFRLNARTVDTSPPLPSSVLTNASFRSVLEVTIALATFVTMLDLSCLLVCSIQCFFAAKLLKCQQGEQRCSKYLRECAGTRFIAVTGFFISVPALLLTLLLYMLLEFSATPAIVSTVILTVGLTFSLITIFHSVYFWRVEKNKADLNVSPYGGRKGAPPRGAGGLSQSELSTLV